MIPTDPNILEKMKELAARNIANGDWGDETTTPGLHGGEMPMTPEERFIQVAGKKKLPPEK